VKGFSSVSRRTRFVAPALAVVAVAVLTVAAGELQGGQTGGVVTVLDVTGSINPGTADYIRAGIEGAAKDFDRVVIIKLDTPGGLLSSTRDIVKTIMASQVPVVVYVAPSGAHAGSAGVFITLSADIAAMAPGTNIGAAHPVGMGGKDPEKDGEHLAKKIENDTVAFMEGIVEKRGRNKDWAVKAVMDSVSITASKALEEKVVDLVAVSVDDLLVKIDGWKVKRDGVTTVLSTTGVRIKERPMSLRQKITTTFSDPNIAYILFMIGILGMLMELYHPGVIFPGVIGGICLILAFISFQVLPINYGGVLLILLGVVLFIAELYVTSYMILGIGGAVSLLIGSLLLIDVMDPNFLFDKEYGVSGWTIAPTVLVIIGFFAFIAYVVLKSQRARSVTGSEGMVGVVCTVTAGIGKDGGKVFYGGEYWFAESDEPIESGSKVVIVEVRGMVLKVKKTEGV